MRLTFKLIIALLVGVLAASCGDDTENVGNNGGTNNGGTNNGGTNNGGTNNGGTNNGGATASFITYNVGLARGFVPYAVERLQPAAEAIGEFDADVVCLQEVWLHQDENDEWVDDQVQTLIDAASENYPHSYWERTTEEGMVGCTMEEAEPLQTCMETHCADVGAGELSDCALANCGDEFSATSQPCQQCLIANLGKTLDEIVAACLEGSSSGVAYDGHNGLLLLSKHELTNTEFTDFEAVLVHRSALHARVAIPGMPETDVYCTHLTADLSDSVDYPSDGTFQSYEEEQEAQITDLLQYVEDTKGSDAVVVMGDMNTGPAAGTWNAEHPDNYQLFVAAGYGNGYLDMLDPGCTYCLANPLNEGMGATGGKIIDHVLTLSLLEPTRAARILDQTQTIETGDGTQVIPLSDHYGVQIDVRASAQ